MTAGVGVTIDANGALSLDSSDPAFNGFIKTNNGSAFNAYVWPGVDGASGQFLQTDGAGNLAWADASGFAVVTVKSGAPTPADVGELWFDCATGTLNVYQNCVGTPSPNWFNVAQPGFPVLPGNTSASPAFATGTGTQADPYGCSVTSVGAGTTVQILNTMTVTTLAPFQFVPIVDLNAVINGGRFSFTNNYADASGNLTFDIVFTDLPTSPTGTPFTALIKIGYGSAYVESRVNIVAPLAVSGGTITGPAYSNQQLTYVPGVASGGSTPYGPLTYQWYADGVAIGGATGLTYTVTAGNVGKVITATTSVTDASGQTATGTSNSIGPIVADPGTLTVLPGSIAPTTAVVGNTLNYTAGSYSLGIPPITATWVWQRAGVDIAGTANLTSYLLVAADAGQAITVRYTATDSSTPIADTAFASTNAVTPTAPFPALVWNPTPSTGLDTIPGLISAPYNGSGPVSSTGCIEISVNGGAYGQGPTPITSGQTLAARWITSPACGDAASGTPLNGTVTDGTYVNAYGPVTVNRKPAPFGFSAGSTTAPLSSLQTSNSVTITGINTTAYITLGSLSAGATVLEARVNGGAWTAVPAAPSTSLSIVDGNTLEVRFVTGSTAGATYTAVVNIGDGDSTQFTASSPGFVVVNTSSTVFPGLTFTPAGGPNAANETVLNVTGGGTLGTLNGVANSNSWPAGLGTTLSSPGGTPTMKFRKGGSGAYVTSGLSINPGEILNLAWNVPYLDTVATGSPANGSITGTVGGTTYTNTFTMTVDRAASFTTTSGASSGASGTITLVSQTPDQYNVPVKVYQTPGTTALTSVTVDINSAGPVSLPTSLATALTLNPGESVVFSATAPAGAATYTTDIHIGDTVHTWSYQVTVTPTVSTPQINNPTSTPAVNPALNSPAGITVTTPTTGNAGGFQTNYGGTQVNSIWTIYKGSYPLGPSTGTIGTVTAGTAGTPGTVQYKNANSADLPSATYQNQVYGKPATDLGATTGNHPMFAWADALTINGYSDWYIPARNELAILYFFLKPNSTANSTVSGSNANSVAPYTPSTSYGPGFPNVTTNALFTAGGTQAFSAGAVDYYWPSTESSGTTTLAWGQSFDAGGQGSSFLKTSNIYARAIRRIPIAEYTAAGSPAIGSYLAGGFYGGQISTAGNGTADYALIVAPAAQGEYGYTGGTNASFTINGADTDGFTVGMQIKGSPSNAVGIILAINSTSIQYLPVSGTFASGDTISTDPASYTAVTGFPLTKTTAPLNEAFIAQANLAVSSKYYASVTFTGSGTPNVVSSPSAWSDFSTVSSFVPAIGAAMGGGYFAGQIVGAGGTSGAGGLDNSGTIYNIIVAPVSSGGLNGEIVGAGIRYRTTAAANPNTANAQNLNFGGLCTEDLKSDAQFPVFNTFINGAGGPNGSAAGGFNLATGGAGGGTGIGGYNDWYLPAKNELAILYFFLKPYLESVGGNANITTSGSNPVSVSPYTPNTNYGPSFPAQTTATDFQDSNTQAFSPTLPYWSSSEYSIDTLRAWYQFFANGSQSTTSNKTGFAYARAIRRVAA